MAGSISVRWDGGERTFPPGSTVRLGRDPGSEVVVANDHVSRRHAELVDVGDEWQLRDVGSAQGTWVDGQRASTVGVSGSLSVSLGMAPNGAVVHLTVDQPAASPLAGTVVPGGALPGTVLPPPPSGATPPTPAPTPAPAAPAAPAPSPSPGTVLVGGGAPDRPGGRLRDSAVAGATVVTGDTVNVECGGSSSTFRPGQTVTIGRDDACDVVTANPTVSRRHATLRHDGQGWLLEDAGSASGTFVGGTRVTSHRLSGSTAAWLGSEDSGERVVLVTSGPTRTGSSKKGGSSRVLIGVAALVVVLVVGGVLFAVTRSSSVSDDALARATVRINAESVIQLGSNRICTVNYTGSGSVIDAERGLILTNAHVAAPTAEGLDQEAVEDCGGATLTDPELMVISLTTSAANPSEAAAEPTYVAELVNADGYLDLAVIRVTRTVGGTILEEGGFDELVEVGIGNSDDVHTGDDVRVLGFPTAAQSDAISVTKGVIQGVVGDPDLGTNRAWFNVDARISGGNSGGMAANGAGKLIGVPTILRAESVGSVRPVNLAKPLIEAAQKGEEYTSPYGG